MVKEVGDEFDIKEELGADAGEERMWREGVRREAARQVLWGVEGSCGLRELERSAQTGKADAIRE